MATLIEPGEEVFLDTSYAVALAAVSDGLHAAALRLADELDAAAAKIVTTQAVLLEIGNALSRGRYRQTAIRYLESAAADPTIRVIPLSAESFDRAAELFRSRPDKEWSLVDCVSFLVMEDLGLTKALTADVHFQQCGFRALLREITD